MNLLFMQNGFPRNGLIEVFDMFGQSGQVVNGKYKGINLQNGSTTGADTNDCTLDGVKAIVGADDYLKSASAAFDDMAAFTCITVASIGTGTTTSKRFFDKFGFGFSVNASTNFLDYYQRTGAAGLHEWISTTPYPATTPSIATISFNRLTPAIAPKIRLGTSLLTLTPSGITADAFTSDATYDLHVANRSSADRSLDGSIYLQVWWNRVLSDAEYIRAYNSLKRTMLQRGVTI